MPRFDRTGPRGLGPRTGRGLGYCNPEELLKPTKKEDKDIAEKIVKKII